MKRVPDELDPETYRTIQALLATGYGEPTFAEGVAAMEQDAERHYAKTAGGAGGSGHLFDWLQGNARPVGGKVPIPAIRADQIVESVRATTAAAEEMLSRRSIRTAVCAALSGVSQDVFDIAKSITPVLTGASLAGTLSIGTPFLLYSVASLLIARAGIASFCRGVDKNTAVKVSGAPQTGRAVKPNAQTTKKRKAGKRR